MAKPDSSGMPSLLPYLKRRQPGLSLRLHWQEPTGSPDEPAAGEPCGPFTTMRTAEIVLDGHEPVAEVMVMTQADGYQYKVSELNPVFNPDVEKTWQDAWGKIQKDTGTRDLESGTLALPSQLGSDGAIIPLRPLFYCRHVDRYGHGLCPLCGRGLDLCRQDDVLEQAGLPPFSRSLQRYLYCPDCHRTSDEAPFYEHRSDNQAPARVRGCNALMEDFSRLLVKAELADDLPCIGCDEAALCYGSETLVLQRMTAVQFYPFHMLLKKAPSLNAVDFLALLAGASGNEIERILSADRKFSRLELVRKAGAWLPTRSGFLFEGDPRLFLEVLYLKLSFLGELLALVSADTDMPINRISMEGLGVSLASTGTRLPFFWNFKLNLIDPVGQPAGHPMGKAAHQSLALELLGAAWFYGLLVNARQPMAAVRQVLDTLRSATGAVQQLSTDGINPALAPGNIFWQPADPALPEAWQALWLQALELGVEVLQYCEGEGQSLTLEQVGSRLEDLKALVRQNLFQEQSGFIAEQAEGGHFRDAEIARILISLLDRWTGAPQAPKEAVQAADMQPNEDGDFEETFILSGSEAPADEAEDISAESELEKTVLISSPGPPDAGEELAKTVVIGASPDKSAEPAEDEIEKTVVIKPPQHGTPSTDPDKTVVVSAPTGQSPEDDLDKTIVARPSPDDDLDKTVVIGESRGQKLMDALEKTVVVNPDRQKTAPSETGKNGDSESQPDEADDLDATVVQPPKSGRDRKPKP